MTVLALIFAVVAIFLVWVFGMWSMCWEGGDALRPATVIFTTVLVIIVLGCVMLCLRHYGFRVVWQKG
jgi:hypothetical protein